MRREHVSVERLAAALLFRDVAAREAMTRQWAFVRAVLMLEALPRGEDLTPTALTRALQGALCQSLIRWLLATWPATTCASREAAR